MIIGSLAPVRFAASPPTPSSAPPVAGESFRATDARKAALDALEAAGRKKPSADLAWLERCFGKNAPDLGDLAKFYVVAQTRYPSSNKGRDELIKSSLESMRTFLDQGNVCTTWQGGQIVSQEETLRMTRDERVDCLLALIRSMPPEKPEYVLPVSNAIGVLGHLRDSIDQKADDMTAAYHVGGGTNNTRCTQFRPLSEPKPGMRQATADYTRYLDSITHAEGRTSPTLEWSDDHSAWSAVKLTYNVFDRDADKCARFDRALRVLQSPWHAMAVAGDLEWVPAAKRDEAEKDILDQVRERRATAGAPQNLLETIDEGTWLNPRTRVTGWSYAVERPGQDRDGAKAEALATLQIIQGKLTDRLQDKAFALCLLGRGDNESSEAVARDLARFTQSLWTHGHSTESAFHIFETLCRVDGFANDRAACVDAFLAQREKLPRGTDPLLVEEAITHTTPSDLGAELGRLREQIFLTGSIDGLDALRGRVEADVKSGVLSGDVDELMRALEIQVKLQRASGASAERSVELAYASLRGSRSRQLTVEVGEDQVVIGGIALPRRPTV